MRRPDVLVPQLSAPQLRQHARNHTGITTIAVGPRAANQPASENAPLEAPISQTMSFGRIRVIKIASCHTQPLPIAGTRWRRGEHGGVSLHRMQADMGRGREQFRSLPLGSAATVGLRTESAFDT
jgi:hypothetical protein